MQNVIDIYTINLGQDDSFESIEKTRCVVTAEEHMMNGGLGDTIAQLLAIENPYQWKWWQLMINLARAGKPEELLKLYGLEAADIVKAVQKVISRKK